MRQLQLQRVLRSIASRQTRQALLLPAALEEGGVSRCLAESGPAKTGKSLDQEFVHQASTHQNVSHRLSVHLRLQRAGVNKMSARVIWCSLQLGAHQQHKQQHHKCSGTEKHVAAPWKTPARVTTGVCTNMAQSSP